MPDKIRLYKRHFTHSSFTGNLGPPCPIEAAVMEATGLPAADVSMSISHIGILDGWFETTLYGPDEYAVDKRKALKSKKDCLIRTIIIH